MLRTLALPALALSVAGCAHTAPAEPGCDVTVRFGSYCCGVDGATQAAVDRYLETAAGVTRTTRKPWGREGESDRCVTARTRADAQRIYRDIAAMIPPVAQRGPVTVLAADGRSSPPQQQK